jgi:MFS family permease
MSENNLVTMVSDNSNNTDSGCCDSSELQLSPKEVSRNILVITLLNATYNTGWTDLNLAMQPFLVFLGASNTMIGIITGSPFMALIGVIISPWITRHFRYKKKYLFFVNVPYLGMAFLMGLAAVLAGWLNIQNSHLLIAVFLLTIAYCFFGGFCSLPSQEYMAACVPMSHRGRLVGYSTSIGGIAAVVAAAAGGWILANVSKPAAFGYVIILGWIIMQGGYFFALLAKELPTPVEKSPKPWSVAMLKTAWEDKSYIRFLLMFFLYTTLVTQSFIFVNIYGFNGLKMAAATAAIMTIVNNGVRICLSVPLGHMADKLKPKRVLPYTFILAAIALFLPIMIPNQYGVYCSIAVSSAFGTLICSAQTALLLGIPSPENRAGCYSLQLLAQNASLAIGPIMMGFLCDMMPYRTVFMIMGIIAIIMIPLCMYMLKTLPDETNSYS